MDRLKVQRQTCKSTLTRIYNACVDERATAEEVKVRAGRAEEVFMRFETIQQEIEYLIEDEQRDQEEAYRVQIEEKYYAIKVLSTRVLDEADVNRTVVDRHQPGNDISAAMQSLMEHQSNMGALIERLSRTTESTVLGSHEATEVPTRQVPAQRELRLPRIQIPEFDGTCTEWIRFRDLFETLVHSRTDVSDVEKIEYLQTRVKGEALSLVKHLKPTHANYEIAWRLLTKKYDRSDKVKRAYLELLLDQLPMKSASVTEAKRVYNTTNESINALKVLDEPVQHWDTILLFNLERKIDAATRVLWYRGKRADEASTLEQFLEFLEKRVFELENTQEGEAQAANHPSNHIKRNQSRTYMAAIQSCPVCSKEHFLYNCNQFKEMDVEARRKIVQRSGACFNCLQPNHRAATCNRSACRKCDAKHNTLLHFAKAVGTQGPQEELQAAKPSTNVIVNSVQQYSRPLTLLPTAIVMVYDTSGKVQQCRALLDSGSQGTLISVACVQRLRLKRTFDKTVLYGVGSDVGNSTRGRVHIQIKSPRDEMAICTEALCLRALTQTLPECNVTSDTLDFLSNFDLADPSCLKPGKIDMILGADVFTECVLSEKITHPSGSPTAIKTIFGWVLMGRVAASANQRLSTAHAVMEFSDQLQRFWEVEDLPGPAQHLTPEEEKAEEHYQRHVRRVENGQYMVRLPFKNDNVDIGETRTAARRRLSSMERRFSSDVFLHGEYHKFMKEYLELGHMGLASTVEPKRTYFLPHHAVLKPTSTTTKLRVVFDASCKSSNGLSLNDHLLVGPTIQRDLFELVIKFRKYEVGMCADIEKMYRQIMVHPEDQSFQRIVWRDSSNEQAREYNLRTVTYGTSAAPFLAIRTLHQLAYDNIEEYPEAATAIIQNFYVDDLMTCAVNEQAAGQLKDEVCRILSSAGFNLRKWSSNSARLIDSIAAKDREEATTTIIDTSQTVNTLGLLWDTTADTFKYSVNLPPLPLTTTKRAVLSSIAKIFDPIGWLAPVVVTMKIFMQTLWVRGLDWDEELPADLSKEWLEYCERINTIPDIRIPRWMEYANEKNVELHGFSDASEMAYSAAIYLRVQRENGDVCTNLVAAKTRVAPVKQITLPRLELCAAHLMTKLLVKVRDSLGLSEVGVFGWTDSTIVLAWISDHPRRWKTFIANRTSEIIGVIPAERWRHIASQQNPADLATRGIRPAELIDSQLWWKGPSVLNHVVTVGAAPPIPDDIDMEERQKMVSNIAVATDTDIIQRYSDYTRLVRVTALLLRFADNCRTKKGNPGKRVEFLTAQELQRAHDVLVRKAQDASYASEMRSLSQGKQLTATHKLAALAPFIDNCGLLRVGGRLANAMVSYNQKHPLILNKDHPFTRLVVRHYHLKYLHAGNRQLHYVLGLRYWIPGSAYVIKQCVYKCTVCMRQRSTTYQQQMGNVPQHRLSPGGAFLNSGVDFAGPVQVRSWKGRGSRRYKCWIALFVCLVTKAIHIEVVTELSTAAFIAAVRRFVARRGKPIHMYSDNGTNFVGANQRLRELYQHLSSTATQDKVARECAEQQIQWHFSPPSGPHFGGLWEAGVKSVKHHLSRTLGDAAVTYEELHTVLCQIEGCLNSRPLCAKFEGDTDPLTPAHFLIMRSSASVPDETIFNFKERSLNRWQYLQQLVQQFWKKWSTEYVTQLQQRPKWTQKLKNLQIGDVVIIKEDNLPASQWSIGRITDTHPGADGLVRVATVRTAKSTLKRPVIKLCPLFIDV